MSASMPPDPELERLKNQHLLAEAELALLKAKKGMGLGRVVWIVGNIGLGMIYMVLWVSYLFFRDTVKRLGRRVLVAQCRLYFYCIGITVPTKKVNGKPLKPGSVILMARESQWKVLLLMTYFPQTLIIPREYRFMKNVGKLMVHWHFFSWALSWISYPDQIFDKQQTRVELLVNAGYNVVTYLNEGGSTLFHSQHLTVSKKMVPFVDQQLLDKHEVWLVNIKGWHARAAGSMKAPIPLHIDFASVEEIYGLKTDRLKTKAEEKKAWMLAHFFGFERVKLLA